VVSGQVQVKGRVYDMAQNPLEAVSVMSTAGNGTTTDSTGRYQIIARETDSIWFSYLNKPTPKYPIRSIPNIQNFEISLHVNTTTLKEIRIMPPSYRRDSIQNREDYAKAFDFHKPGIGSSVNPDGGVGLDLDEFIGMFQFRRNRRMAAFQKRLLQEEEERYIDHRFSRALIIRLTQLHGPALDSFIVQYRPALYFVQTATDYELQQYIMECFVNYQKYRNMMNELKKPED
jgi:hypothetical protein